jgi:Zn-dependent M28 family amino/carboxypeptidase
MLALLLALGLFTSGASFAQPHLDDHHDWRQDYMAYLSVEYDFPLSYQNKVQTHYSSKRLDMAFFKEKLITLSNTPDRRSTDNLDIARQFLKSEYEKIGFEVRFENFGGGSNFVAEKKGITSPQKVLILSSHIDSVRCKGANDNGTGTIGLLTVAQELAKNNYPYTVRVLGFDKEETGLVGSDAYVASIQNKSNIIGNINFEMMGVNSRKDGSFHVIDCQKATSVAISNEIRSSIANLGLPLTIVKACTDRSDHASFWRHNLPAVVISENFFGGDADACYHAKCDIVDERLDYSYMGNILEAVLDATEHLLK